MNLLVVQQVGWLEKALIAEVALERAVSWVLMSTTVANEGILLFEAHLALLALERSLLRVGALVLSQVRRPLKTLST